MGSGVLPVCGRGRGGTGVRQGRMNLPRRYSKELRLGVCKGRRTAEHLGADYGGSGLELGLA